MDQTNVDECMALREKQDVLIDLASARHVSLDLQIMADEPGSPTIRDLIPYIYPAWEFAIDYAIKYLKEGK